MSPEFLTRDDILEIHALQLGRYGGASGVRDQGLLESALAQPRAAVSGRFVHPDVFHMAAAYLFHIVKNHAFVDGNKRTGLLVALVFLDVNGTSVDCSSDDLYDVTMAVANGRATKEEVAESLRRIAGAT